MRKIVLFIAALLFMAVPVMAVPSNVTITCAKDDVAKTVTVSYSSDANRIRAFGLDITVDVNKITQVVVLDPCGTKYRIYPGQIVIVNGEVTDYNKPYDPCDINDANVAIEMGSLYTTDPCYAPGKPLYDPNMGYNMIPGLYGDLLKFYVAGDCNYTVDVNVRRGGIVMEDPYEEPNVNNNVSPLCTGHVGGVAPPDYYDFGDAPNTYWTTKAVNGPNHTMAGTTTGIGPILGAFIDAEADGVPTPNCDGDDLAVPIPDDENGITNLVATSTTAGSVTVTVFQAAGYLNAFVDFNNNGVFDVPSSEQIFTNKPVVIGANNLNFVIPAGATKEKYLVNRWRVTSYTLPTGQYYGPATDGEVEDYNSISNGGLFISCMKNPTTPASIRNDWVTWLKPRCWCYERNCRGDSDGIKTLGNWVALADLNLLKMAYGKADAVLQTIVLNGVPGICCDFDHIKTLGNRVALADLNTLKAYYGKAEASVPVCDLSPNYYFWCTPPATCPANF